MQEITIVIEEGTMPLQVVTKKLMTPAFRKNFRETQENHFLYIVSLMEWKFPAESVDELEHTVDYRLRNLRLRMNKQIPQ